MWVFDWNSRNSFGDGVMRTKTTYLTNLNGLTGEKALLIEPLRQIPIEQRRGIIALHGHGADASVWTPGWAGARHLQALADAGYFIVSIDAGGPATFNNIAAMTAITSAYGYLTSVVGLAEAQVGLFGWSMGGGNALQWIKENPTKVWAALLWCPLTDLDYHSGYPGAVGAEYQAAYSPPIYAAGDYAVNSVGHKIADEYPTWRNKCPIRIIQGTADTTVPMAKSQAFVTGVNQPQVDIVLLAGSNHSNLFANYLTDATLDFFRTNEDPLQVYVPAPIKSLTPESVMYQDSARTTLALANNDPCGSWSDPQSNQHASQATAGKRPLVKTNVLNGYRVLEFDGVDDYMEATIAAKIAATTFLVVRRLDAVHGRTLVGWKVDSSNRVVMYGSAVGYSYYANEALTSEDIPCIASDWNIVVVRHPSASEVEWRVGGKAPVATFDPYDNLTTAITLMLGANNNVAGTFGKFQIADYLRYDDALSLDQVNVVGSALAAKYVLPWETAI